MMMNINTCFNSLARVYCLRGDLFVVATCEVFDNRRVLHARSQILPTDGERWVQGAQHGVKQGILGVSLDSSSVWARFRDCCWC